MLSRSFIYRERERAEQRERCWDSVEWEQQEELVGWLFPCPHGFGPALLKAKSTAALREMQKKWGFKALGLENLKLKLPHSSCCSSKPKLLVMFGLVRGRVSNFNVSRGENSIF